MYFVLWSVTVQHTRWNTTFITESNREIVFMCCRLQIHTLHVRKEQSRRTKQALREHIPTPSISSLFVFLINQTSLKKDTSVDFGKNSARGFLRYGHFYKMAFRHRPFQHQALHICGVSKKQTGWDGIAGIFFSKIQFFIIYLFIYFLALTFDLNWISWTPCQ